MSAGRCPNCGAAFRAGASFCPSCGTALAATCPNCGSPVEPDARFCQTCGLALRPAGDERRDPIRRYMPSELAGRLESARAKGSMQGERRIVTALFCDVTGSTSMAERLDPEEWTDIMNAAYERLIAPVFRYEGTVARLMGDAILAFFGAPIAHEDDPERAVLAGLEIVSGVGTFREELARERGLDFNVRVGINTGLVVVGEVGSDLRLEYTAMGDAVNLAARMEQTATPGTVQISEDTHRQVAPLFDVEPLGPIEVKGKREPVGAFRVLGRKAAPGPTRGIEGLRAPLVGREVEMAALRSFLEVLREGRGGIACLVGEAGLGKSRIVRELREVWGAQEGNGDGGQTWIEAQALSYDSARPYGQFQDLVRGVVGAVEGEPAAQVREKIRARFAHLPPDRQGRIERGLAAILAVEGDGGGELEGEALKREIFEVVLETGSGLEGPRVLVFEDVHWADPISAELLQHLLQLTDREPLGIMVTLRPDRTAPGWSVKQAAESRFHDRYIEVALRPLSPDESESLVDGLLAVSELPREVVDAIGGRAEGNPFFLEEVIRTLIERGSLRRRDGSWTLAGDPGDLAIPDSVQALLTARIDRLEEGPRHLLQAASVIGRSFSFPVLERVRGDEGAAIEPDLVRLERADLITEVARLPERDYEFRHALTREAAYSSILLRTRRDLHRRAGEAIEELYADRLEEWAPVLGLHFFEADDPRALAYYTTAGDAAARLYANDEAAGFYARAIEVAGQQDTPSDGLLHLFTSRGRSLELAGRHDEAMATYREMERLAQERNDLRLELASVRARGTVLSTPSPMFNREEAERLGARALELAGRLGDRGAEAGVLWNRMLLTIFGGGDMTAAVTDGERALALARQEGLREQEAFAIHDLWRAYAGVGDYASARAAVDQAHALWVELGNKPMLGDSIASQAAVFMIEGRYREAAERADEAYRLFLDLENDWGVTYTASMLLYPSLELGELDIALEALDARLAIVRAVGAPLAGALAWRTAHDDLAHTMLTMGRLEEAVEAVETVGRATETMVQDPIHRSYGNAVRALISAERDDAQQLERALQESEEAHAPEPLLSVLETLRTIAGARGAIARGDLGAAQAVLDRRLERHRRSGMRVFLPDLLALEARVLLGEGRTEGALARLRGARDEAIATECRRSLWRIDYELAALELQMGDLDVATASLAEGDEVVEHIAAHAGREDLAGSFREYSRRFRPDLGEGSSAATAPTRGPR